MRNGQPAEPTAHDDLVNDLSTRLLRLIAYRGGALRAPCLRAQTVKLAARCQDLGYLKLARYSASLTPARLSSFPSSARLTSECSGIERVAGWPGLLSK
jgi:hypothetical protein